MVLVVNDDQQIATLIELNFFKAVRDQKPIYHFNRAVDNLLNINKVYIDPKRAFLIGDNIHFIYRTNIFHKFTNQKDILLYEFVARDMKVIRPMQFFHPKQRQKTFFSKSRFYGINSKGVDVYDHVYKSPTIKCHPGGFDIEKSQKTDFVDHTFTYKVSFVQQRCKDMPKGKMFEDHLFTSCNITSDFVVEVLSESAY